MASFPDLLRAVLAARLDSPGREWLTSATASASRGDTGITAALTHATRHVGRQPLALSEDEARALASTAPGIGFDRWSRGDAVRVLLLVAFAAAVPEDTFASTATEWFEVGDTAEQQSWLRALPLLPRPKRFLAHAIDACRTNIVPLFESIACENPYPRDYFPTAQFNQLVMKSMFVGLPLVRIVGLPGRRNDELTRMARDFADERRAAGRPIPADLGLALADPQPPEPT